MIIHTNHIITREEVRANPTTLYLFGDNTLRVGRGGQAKEMRGHVNTVGIRTKKFPSNKDGAFFTDDEYSQNIAMMKADMNTAFMKYIKDRYLCLTIPPIGTGLADLPRRAPDTYKFWLSLLDQAEQYIQIIDQKRKQPPGRLDFKTKHYL